MNESYFKYQQSYSYLRHSSLMPKRKTLLFLHGIGDSSLSYLPFLHSEALSTFNMVIPDLLGYGKSSMNNDYRFDKQVEVIIEHLSALEESNNLSFDNIILIVHSMSGIHAMRLCHSKIKDKIKGVINIEGSITEYGSFISEAVAKAAEKGDFIACFQEFKEAFIFEKFIKQFPCCRSYYASLAFCDPNVFLQNAIEIYQTCHAVRTEKYTNSAGRQFAELALPKIYCYGDKSLCQESIEFLTENNIPTKVFNSKNHFVMLDYFDEFVLFIKDWVNKIR